MSLKFFAICLDCYHSGKFELNASDFLSIMAIILLIIKKNFFSVTESVKITNIFCVDLKKLCTKEDMKNS